MKKTITLFLIAATFGLSAQITIPSSGLILPVAPDSAKSFELNGAGALAIPAGGANKNWDYSAATNVGVPYKYSYQPYDFNPNFSGAVATRFYSSGLGPIVITGTRAYYGQDNSKMIDMGFEIAAQSFSIGSISGNNNDTLKILNSVNNFGTSARIYNFPLNYTDGYASSNKATTDFILSVSVFNIFNTPGEIVQTVANKDTVLGWGSLSLGANGFVNVPALLVKHTTKQTDSIFLGGVPAPPAILTAFGLTQGTVSYENYYLFLVYDSQEAKLRPALVFVMDANFSTITGANYDRATHKSLGFVDESLTLMPTLYPNPVGDAGFLTVDFKAPLTELANIKIVGINGVITHETVAEAGQTHVQIATTHMSAGIYIVEATNTAGKKLYVSQFVKQ